MKNVNRRPSLVHAPTLVLACVSAACSGEYPLGNLSDHEQRLDQVPGDVALADASLSPVLGAPDVSIDAHDLKGSWPGNVVAAGDLDGDGFEDMAVLAWDFDTDAQYVHLRYGGPRPTTPTDTLAFELGGGYLLMPSPQLSSLSAAGDVDGDGYDDLLVLSYECETTKAEEGVYLMYGGPERRGGADLLTDAAVHFVRPTVVETIPSGGCTGFPSSGNAGDLDGDGIDDLVLSSHMLSGATGSPGVYVFYGRRERFAGEVPFADADATFRAAHELSAVPTGDVNADGLADLLIGSQSVEPRVTPSRFAFVPGRAERWSGAVDLEANAVGFDGLWVDEVSSLAGGALGDLDGDGINDVMLKQDGDFASFVFYGAPGLFAQGADVAKADARVRALSESFLGLFPAGDMDGDGDDELVARFKVDSRPIAADVAIVGGSSERLAGTFWVPEAEALEHGPRFRDPERESEYTYSAGDLDADGAGDLFSLSHVFKEKPDGHFELERPQIHIHYGPRPPSNPLR